MLQFLCVFLILQTIFSFPLPAITPAGDCEKCACSTKNWVCNIKCPGQETGSRAVCGVEEYLTGKWSPSQPFLQSANNFCLKAQLVNERAHLAVGNFFQQTAELNWADSLDCRSIRLGDENKRQKITFDLIPAIHENPDQPELIIFERANGTKDGLLDAHTSSPLPLDNHLPEGYAFALLVDGTWTKFFYSAVRGSFVQFRDNLVPDWKNQELGYNMDYDAWSNVIEFRDLGLSEGSVVSGISLINLQPGDMILGRFSDLGEVVFKEDVAKVCANDNCVQPIISIANKGFGNLDYDPDIVWIGPFSGQQAKKRNLH